MATQNINKISTLYSYMYLLTLYHHKHIAIIIMHASLRASFATSQNSFQQNWLTLVILLLPKPLHKLSASDETVVKQIVNVNLVVYHQITHEWVFGATVFDIAAQY